MLRKDQPFGSLCGRGERLDRAIALETGQHRLLASEGGMGDQLVEGIPVARTTQANQVVAQSPTDAFHKVLQHDAIKSTKQLGSCLVSFEGDTDVVQLAPCEEHTNSIELQKLWIVE